MEALTLAALVSDIARLDLAWVLMSRSTAPEHCHLWQHVVSRTPRAHAAGALALYGFASWLAGSTVGTRDAVEALAEHSPQLQHGAPALQLIDGPVPRPSGMNRCKPQHATSWRRRPNGPKRTRQQLRPTSATGWPHSADGRTSQGRPSEGRHRPDLDRANAAIRKSIEANENAEATMQLLGATSIQELDHTRQA